MNTLDRSFFVTAFVFTSILPALSQGGPEILVVYYSETGKTKAMAEAVARGARSVDGVTVTLATVGESRADDAIRADAIIIGSPVHNAAVAPPVQQFINSWPFDGRMRDKIGAAFVTGGGISAGEELVQTGILHSMLIFGMIVVGGPEWTSAFGASAVTGEAPFGPEGPSNQFMRKAELLGERVAELSKKFKHLTK